MITEHREDGWHVVGVPGVEACGPYETRAVADSDRVGMQQFYRHELGGHDSGHDRQSPARGTGEVDRHDRKAKTIGNEAGPSVPRG